MLLAETEVLGDLVGHRGVRGPRRQGRQAHSGHEHVAAIRGWVTVADDAAAVGRSLVLSALLTNGAALDENLPPVVPRWLRPALRPVTRNLTMKFVRKYDLRLEEGEAHTRALRLALDRLRVALAASSPYLQGAFSFADIAMATLGPGNLSGLRSLREDVGPATRVTWTQAPLAAEYADLVAWRDELLRELPAVSGRAPPPAACCDRRDGILVRHDARAEAAGTRACAWVKSAPRNKICAE